MNRSDIQRMDRLTEMTLPGFMEGMLGDMERQDIEWALTTIEGQATRISELEAIHKCPHCGGRADMLPGHIERCYCLPVIREKNKDIERMSQEIQKLRELMSGLICFVCANRIGFQGSTGCPSCRPSRTALEAVK